MERINYNSLKFIKFFDNLNPQNSGIFFSIFLHLTILLFAIGIPNFFGPKNIYIPNIIPIEILNVSETTNIEKNEKNIEVNKNTLSKQKKFNSSENTEVQKQVELKQNIKNISNENDTKINIKEKSNIQIEEKKIVEIKEKKITEAKLKVESIKTEKIKPKIKPKPKQVVSKEINSDIQIQPKTKKSEPQKDEALTKPKPKPEEDFSIASMLKDLRNEKSNNSIEDEKTEEESNQTDEDKTNENMILSISEIDLLRQQLSSCWNAPAGAVIERGMKVTISAKVQQNMKVFENSVRIIDTNISKSNAFYGPITDSAMRTLLNPECTPLKLPKDKYKLWKNLTITFDYSIMKGY